MPYIIWKNPSDERYGPTAVGVCNKDEVDAIIAKLIKDGNNEKQTSARMVQLKKQEGDLIKKREKLKAEKLNFPEKSSLPDELRMNFNKILSHANAEIERKIVEVNKNLDSVKGEIQYEARRGVHYYFTKVPRIRLNQEV